MSLFDDLFGMSSEKADRNFTPPSPLCPGDCPIGPEACAECSPYKERLNDALYNVDHIDEYYDRFEVTGSAQSTGQTTLCPHCGAASEDPFRCEYCGMQLKEGDGKVRVASANDIPDPIIEARDIIYDRYSEVVSKYGGDASSEGMPTGGSLISMLLGLIADEGGESEGLGARMSREDITEAANIYGVSLSAYLNGLDNGKYLTLERKKAYENAKQSGQINDMGFGGQSGFGGQPGMGMGDQSGMGFGSAAAAMMMSGLMGSMMGGQGQQGGMFGLGQPRPQQGNMGYGQPQPQQPPRPTQSHGQSVPRPTSQPPRPQSAGIPRPTQSSGIPRPTNAVPKPTHDNPNGIPRPTQNHAQQPPRPTQAGQARPQQPPRPTQAGQARPQQPPRPTQAGQAHPQQPPRPQPPRPGASGPQKPPKPGGLGGLFGKK
ncbi:MAG: hypothetical protein IIY34_06345 [Clostridia bacterium]|nr:hypothetical protein [Clostridia bacterium]